MESINKNIAEAQQIVYIPVADLVPHPDNPRKDIGDITELAESIKANGVLQNLTVVPFFSKETNEVVPGKYMVIIGHRRSAAAKSAGVETVPCVIRDMSPSEQVATMLSENMQRSDLTIYEQAKSFHQLALDFGKTTQEISAMSGFSETTVRRRQKLAELDEKKFKAACNRGATLFDFAELEKIEDPAAKEKCLDVIGTQNFKNVLRSALDEQRAKKKMVVWQTQLKAFATQIEQQGYVDGERVEMDYFRNYGSWTRDESVAVPEDANEVRYFFTVTSQQISVYKERVANSKEEALQKAKAELSAMDDEAWERAAEINDRHKELRRDFVMNYDAAKSHAQIIIKNSIDGMFANATRGSYYCNFDMKDFSNLLGIDYDDDRKRPDMEAFKRLKAEQPEKTLLLTTYWYMDNYGSYARRGWNKEVHRYVVEYVNNQNLDSLYYFLEELGYERSDEERQMSRGTHEVFVLPKPDGKTACLLCKSAHPACDKCCVSCTERCNAYQECRKEE